MEQEKIKIFSDKYLSRQEELEDRVNDFLKKICDAGGKVLEVHLTCRPNNLLVVCVRYIEDYIEEE